MSSQEFPLRQNIQSLTTLDLENIREAFRRIMNIHDERGFNYIAGIHGAPQNQCWHHQVHRGSNTGLRLFLPWHRAYLYKLEQALKDAMQNDHSSAEIARINLPWWDWRSDDSRNNGIPNSYSEETINGQPNPLYEFHINVCSIRNPIDRDTVRNPRSPTSLPPDNAVEQLLEMNYFYDFTNAMQNIHDRIHGWVGGDMASVQTSAFDPIFWAHHCMIDRIWWLWQGKHGMNNIPNPFLDKVLPPFEFTVKDVLNAQDLGYDYSSSITSVPGPGGP